MRAGPDPADSSARRASMGRRLWWRRALVAACLGAALLLLRPGECPPAPGPPHQRPDPRPGGGTGAGGLRKALNAPPLSRLPARVLSPREWVSQGPER